MEKRIIWTDDIDENDFEDMDGNPVSYEEALQINADMLEDERDNFNMSAGGEIICLADLGLWDGRRSAHKLIGNKVSNIFYSRMDSMSYNEWFYDGKDICHTESHHDGTNHYIYRVLKGNTHDEQIENAEKLFSKPVTKQRIGIYTKSLSPIVKEVYGW